MSPLKASSSLELAERNFITGFTDWYDDQMHDMEITSRDLWLWSGMNSNHNGERPEPMCDF